MVASCQGGQHQGMIEHAAGHSMSRYTTLETIEGSQAPLSLRNVRVIVFTFPPCAGGVRLMRPSRTRKLPTVTRSRKVWRVCRPGCGCASSRPAPIVPKDRTASSGRAGLLCSLGYGQSRPAPCAFQMRCTEDTLMPAASVVEFQVWRQLAQALRPALIDQRARRPSGRSYRLSRRRSLRQMGRQGTADGSRVGIRGARRAGRR